MGAGSIALIGGHLALDFANTAGMHASDTRDEWLTSYEEMLAWARHAGALPARRAARLAEAARRHPARARDALRRILGLREATYRAFTAVAQDASPAADDLATVRDAWAQALSRAVAVWRDGSLRLDWPDGPLDFLVPVHPVMIAVAELLTAPAPGRLRQCARHPCGWLFIDRSRNGSRRWCSSEDCGNLTRVQRFRQRQAEP